MFTGTNAYSHVTCLTMPSLNRDIDIVDPIIMPSLNRDIVDLIIDRWRYRPTLLDNASLVSPEWRERARYHIFHHVRVNLAKDPTLSCVPLSTIQHHTRTLEVDGEHGLDLWTCLETIFSTVSGMEHLTELVLTNLSSSVRGAWPENWVEGTPKRNKIVTLRLRGIEVHSMLVLLVAVKTFESITSLSLWDLKWKQEDRERSSPKTLQALFDRLPPPRMIRELCLVGLPPSLLAVFSIWLMRAYTSIKTLHWGAEIQPDTRCAKMTHAVLNDLGAVVENLVLVYLGQGMQHYASRRFKI